ncbi:MAG: sulfite exporter TauE/SafE family protein, partial [Candidatus Komeilibacteria bacterium]|nr:sulfite exporter TauE/SafE family protein [Candidatus Komeilibacteria bacterium]
MKKIIVPIKGMHCRSCEMVVESALSKIPGVKKTEVNYRAGRAEIFCGECLPSSELIKQAVKDAGYEIGQKGKAPWFSQDKDDYLNLLKGAAIVLALFFAAKWLGLFNLGVETQKTSLLIVLAVGLVAGISTCMALVGGLVLGLSARHAELHPEITSKQKFVPHLYFNLGRIIGFAFLGGLIGLLGSAVRPSTGVIGLKTIVIGGVMIFLGLKLVEIFPALKDKSLALPKGLAKALGLHQEQKEYSHTGSFITGALTFFLPCGFTQAMQLYAVATGSFIQGALIMGLFALGTSVGLLGVGGLASIFKGKGAKIFFAATGVAVILLGWFNIANGSQVLFSGRAAGLPADSPTDSVGVQEVKMTQNSSGYSPN